MSTSCVFVSTPPGYSSEGLIRPRRESAVAKVTKDGTREHDRLTGFNNMIKKGPCLLLTPAWLTDRGRATIIPGYVLTASSAKY